MRIATGSEKGGCGKSSVAVGLAGALVEAGQQVLVVDLDPSGGATYALGARSDGAALRQVLDGHAPLEPVVAETSTPGLWLAAGGRALLGWSPPRRRTLGPALDEYGGRWQTIVLDTPPGASPLLGEALAAAEVVIVPCEPSPAGLMGPAVFERTLARAREDNPQLVDRIVVARADVRLRATVECIDHLRKTYGKRVAAAEVPSSARVVEAPSFGVPVTVHAPRSSAAKAFRALARELGRVRVAR